MKKLYVQSTKKERLKYNNYRLITLLNIAYKTLVILLNKRLYDIAEKKLEECQTGFHPIGSTIDNIFIIWQIFESAMNIKEICIIYSLTIHKLLTIKIGIKYYSV
jgi:Reverse transcriptase (RNA-dependent DNA polymerase).